MHVIIYFLIILLLFGILSPLKIESFDGIGKGFGMYYHPKSCCKSKSCYPGMYLGNDFWLLNWW